jgi:hypothetical protein
MPIKIDETNVVAVALREGERKLNDFIARRQRKDDELSEETERRLASQRSALKLEAEALLTGEPVKTGATGADLEKLRREIEILNEAIAQQTRLVDGLRSKYSVVVCNGNRGSYIAIERRILRAVRELAAANEAEVLFFRELQDAGCTSIQFRPMRVSAVGLLSDDQSLAMFHRREVETYLPEAIS